MAGFEPTGTTASHSVFDALGYAWGQCTAFVAESVGWLGGGAGLGTAKNWLSNAAAQGYTTTNAPVVGSVAVFGGGMPGSGGAGHVALVTGVSGSSFSTAEANVQGLDVVSSGDYSTSNTNLLGFILPKGDTSLASPGVGANLTGTFSLPGGILDPLNIPGEIINATVGGASGGTSGGIDLNPADWAGEIGGLIGGIVLRMIIAILAVVFILKGLELIGNSTGHDLSISLPSGAATGGATKGIAEDAGEAAAA